MKSFIIMLSCISCFYFLKHDHKEVRFIQQATTLDSLQGHWVCTQDSLWQLTITGRGVDEFYKDSDLAQQHEYFTIFFSDTLVDGMQYDYNTAKINTTATTGKYLVEVAGNEIWCSEIAGFYVDSSGETFEYQPTWTHEGPNIFFKQ